MWSLFICFVVVLFAHPVNAEEVLQNQNSWHPRMDWSGDLRYRFARLREAEDDERALQQLRVRLGVKADVNEETKVVLRLATGSSAISTNQTLGDSKDPGMARRSFGLDLAYAEFLLLKDSKIWIGRTANPFWSPAKVQTIFDSDLAFEGFAFKSEKKWSQSSAFLNFGAFIISENYQSRPDPAMDIVDTGLVGVELGYQHKLEFGSIVARLGQYKYINIQDKMIGTVEKDAKYDPFSYPYDRYRGNTIYPNDPNLPSSQRVFYFLNPYTITSAGVEIKSKISSLELLGFVETAKNIELSSENTAIEYGLSCKYGQLSVLYAQIEKKADSVFAAFADSDSNGGGTDNKGFRISTSYELAPQAITSLNYFAAYRGVASVERQFRLTQLDFVFSF